MLEPAYELLGFSSYNVLSLLLVETRSGDQSEKHLRHPEVDNPSFSIRKIEIRRLLGAVCVSLCSGLGHIPALLWR